MTDLLAPLLAALDEEAEAFWCFTKLVQSSAFYKPGKDHISVTHQIVSKYAFNYIPVRRPQINQHCAVDEYNYNYGGTCTH